MGSSKDERDRILLLLEAGQISATEAAQLLDALEEDWERSPGPRRQRVLHVRTTNVRASAQKMHLSANIPVPLLKQSLRLGAYLIPQLSSETLADLLRAIENGASGRLLDLQDMEHGQRLEIFVE
jgi:hypothetical protein